MGMNGLQKRPRIGILTLQSVNNYGSYLQAYATQRIFEENGRFDVVFYDYYPYSTRFLGLLKHWTNWNPVKVIAMFPTIMRWRKIFKGFREKNLHLTPNKYYTVDDFYQKPLDCDAICVGSDQVWNRIWNKGIVPELYLKYADVEKYLFSFASSFGREFVDEDEVKITKPWLARFNRLSVRESSAYEILKKQYGISDIEVLMDPTLLLTVEEWRKQECKMRQKSKYILIYNLFRRKDFDEYARELSKKTGLKLVRICFRYDQIFRVGKSVLLPTVQKFLALIDNAEYILTDSFHGTAFAFLFNTNPICYLPPVFSTRIVDFLKRMEAEDRITRSQDDFSMLDKTIDFDNVNRKLQDARNQKDIFLNKIHSDLESFHNSNNDE